MYKFLFGALGITDLSNALLDSKYYGTRNFHGYYYLDSDKLENYLHFRHDSSSTITIATSSSLDRR